MEIRDKTIATGIVMFGAAAMIFARRHNNHRSDAGYGIAGWAILIVIFIWL